MNSIDIGGLGVAEKPLLPGSRLAGLSVGAKYDGPVKEMILKFKFQRLRAATEASAGLLLRRSNRWPEVAAVTCVPVAADRYRERGYNQSELLAREVARQIGVPYRGLLGRRKSAHQIGLGRADRLERVSGVFYALRGLDGESLLIVDDVVTTGATMSECAGVLAEAGAGEVWGAAVASR